MKRVKKLFFILAIVSPILATGSVVGCGDSTGPSGCCKTCTTGKACGDTCISRDKTCHVGPGCACNG